jgi:hypothetical protein
MKKLLLFFVTLLISNFYRGYAQTWQWAQNLSPSYESGTAESVAPDNSGNVYVLGESQIFKCNAAGSVVWSVPIHDDVFTSEIAADVDGNVYAAYLNIAAGFVGQTTFEKYDPNGNLKWSTTAYTGVAPGSNNIPWAITTSKDGSVYITGLLAGPYFIVGTDTLVNPQWAAIDTAAFVVKFDTSGNFKWSKSISSIGKTAVYGIAADSLGNIFIAGAVNYDTVSIGTAIVPLAGAGNHFFVAKCDSGLHITWIHPDVFPPYTYLASEWDMNRFYQVGTDAYGNAYVAGAYNSSTSLGGIALTSPNNIFVAKYNGATGNVLWAETGKSTLNMPYSFATNLYGNSYLLFASVATSHFSDSVFTFSSTGPSVQTATIVALDSSGKVLYGTILGGQSGDDQIGVGIDKYNNAYVSGDFVDSCRFGAIELYGYSPPYEPSFVAKLGWPYPIISVSAITGDSVICKGDTLLLADATPGGTWTNGNPAVATLYSPTAVLVGLAAGTTIITYTVGVVNQVFFTVSVVTTPSIIPGDTALCAGLTTTLSATTAGGIWSSSDTGIANVQPLTGSLLGVAAGYATITYALSPDCFATVVDSVKNCTETVERLPIAQDIELMPCPAADELTIAFVPAQITAFSIVTAEGKILQNGALTAPTTKIDIGLLPPGIYYVMLRGGEGAIVKKFVKN